MEQITPEKYVIKNYDYYESEILENTRIEGVEEITVHKVRDDTVLIQEMNTETGIGYIRNIERGIFEEITKENYLQKISD